MNWARILAYVTWTVDQELLARNEYLAAENRILKAQLNGRVKLSDAERGVLGEIGHRLGRNALADVATIARPDTIPGWYRKLVARKFDGSKARRRPGRPRIKREVEQLIIRMASENRSWGYDRLAGALANLGYDISDQTVGNVLRRHGLPPAPARRGREDDDDRRGSRSRRRDDDDDRRSDSRSRGRSDEGHGGWFGDPRRHAQAARRGWENRR